MGEVEKSSRLDVERGLRGEAERFRAQDRLAFEIVAHGLTGAETRCGLGEHPQADVEPAPVGEMVRERPTWLKTRCIMSP